MHIGILGAGNVGGTLAKRFLGAGHSITIGARDPLKTRAAITEATMAVATVAELRSCAVVVLATPWNGAVDAVRQLQPPAGQILIDATNPIRGRLEGLTPGGDDSGGETIQRAVPQSRVVKAFNTCGFEVMADPVFTHGRACMPVCGDDPAARQVVLDLATAIGFQSLDWGQLRNARWLEPLAMAWITRAIVLGAGRRWAFSVVS
jgi:8-hydroxy-5-deazaflavin:NADPH oxidoreductase